MDKPFLDAYSRLLIRTCHRRGALAMGGMSAFIPRKDPAENAQVLERVRADKAREAANGHDGSWIAHPGLSDVVNEVYGAAFAPGRTNQLEVSRANDARLLGRRPAGAPAGPDHRGRAAAQPAGSRCSTSRPGLGGSGAVAIYGLMEDAATAEISRASIWQWLKNGVVLDGGVPMTVELFDRAFAEELAVVRGEVGEDRWASGRWAEAAELMRDLCLQDEFAEFLTLSAYERL